MKTSSTPSSHEIRRRFIDFFVQKYGHKEIPSASLIPENDPTVLFTTAGMHPLVPFLMGEPHPMGRRLVDAQKSLRTDDIDEVGDSTHATFFEMMGNWSLGDYFKKEAIEMSYELLTTSWEKGGYFLDPARMSVTCFAGDSDAPRDTESAEIWARTGIPKERIFFYPKKKNWWGPAGQTGPCGPDTEMFYDTMYGEDRRKHCIDNRTADLSLRLCRLEDKYPPIDCPSFKPGDCHPNCDCGRYVEIWNDVFMQYEKKFDGSFVPLKQKNVDTGLGLERMTAILQGKATHYETDLFTSAIEKIKSMAKILYALDSNGHKTSPDASNDNENAAYFHLPEVVRSLRIIADHLRAAVFVIGDPRGVSPSNVDQGYIVRRLIRRAIRHLKLIGVETMRQIAKDRFTTAVTPQIAAVFIEIYQSVYPELRENKDRILLELEREEMRFSLVLDKGLRELHRIVEAKKGALFGGAPGGDFVEAPGSVLGGGDAFYIFETYGFPLEMIEEELKKEGHLFVRDEKFQRDFDEAFKKHQEQSRVGAQQKFAGGLADHSEECKMHHTATHLVHQALRDVLGAHVFQKGSNITRERLRFDFSHPVKMSPEQIREVERIVNEQIQRDLPVHFEVLDTSEAKKRGAIGLFDDKYATLGNRVKVYFMGDYSKEVCGGPHVEHTGVLKGFRILKEEAVAAGVRRIKAVVDGLNFLI